MRFDDFRAGLHGKIVGAAVALSALLVARELRAEPFVYVARDLLLGIRQTGAVNDFVVNLGSSSNYFNAASGSTLTITNFSAQQLQTAFGTLDSLIWSVSGGVRIGDGGGPSSPNGTLWLTHARTDPAVQSE